MSLCGFIPHPSTFYFFFHFTIRFMSRIVSTFFSSSQNVKKKFDYVFNVVQTVYNIPQKFIKKLENTDFYEMRVSIGKNEYRSVLFAIDHDNVIESTRIILLNGFLKKSTKDYKREIDKAENILNKLEL